MWFQHCFGLQLFAPNTVDVLFKHLTIALTQSLSSYCISGLNLDHPINFEYGTAQQEWKLQISGQRLELLLYNLVSLDTADSN